jgi:hypothetical protein
MFYMFCCNKKIVLVVSFLMVSSICFAADMKFGLSFDSSKTFYEPKDSFWVDVDIQSPSNQNNIDLYLIVIDPASAVYFGLNWTLTPTPVLKNYPLPAGISITKAPIIQISIPNQTPPVFDFGSYTFAIAATTPNTFNIISEIGIANFQIGVKDKDIPAGYPQNIDSTSFVYIPGGEFMMGSDNSSLNESPIHKVKLDGFWMSKYEVTQKEWAAFTAEKSPTLVGDNLPVDNVSWDEIANWFVLHPNFRLPTEAEWEYACRANSTTDWFWGSNRFGGDEYCWYVTNSGGKYHPVGQKKPNAWGLYDIQGNVTEWCFDWMVEDYYSNCPEYNPIPTAPGGSGYRVHRGGDFYAVPEKLRSAYRYSWSQMDGYPYLGFRLVSDYI